MQFRQPATACTHADVGRAAEGGGTRGRVRERIRAALAGGRVVDGEGRESRWELRSSGASRVRPEEADHADRLAAG